MRARRSEPDRPYASPRFDSAFNPFGALGAAALRDLSTYACLDPSFGGKTGFSLHLPGDFYSEIYSESQVEEISDAGLKTKVLTAEAEERTEFKNQLLRSLLPRLIAEQPLTISPSAQFTSFGGGGFVLDGRGIGA